MAHAQFEEFCVLAASGQLSVVEARALDEHLRECADCRRFLGDLRLISGSVLPGVFAESSFVRVIPEGMRDRFLARAASEGIAIHAGPQLLTTVGSTSGSAIHAAQGATAAPSSSQRLGGMDTALSSLNFWRRITQYWQPLALAVSACAVCFGLGAVVRPQSHEPASIAAAHVITANSSLPATGKVGIAKNDAPREAIPAQTLDAQKLEQERAQLESEREALDNEKSSTEKEFQEKMAALESDAARDHEGLVQQTVGLSSRLQTLQQQLDALKEKQMQTEAILTVQEQETYKYSSRAAELEAQLANVARVPSINPDEVQSLVAARNLHIIDVYDSDGVGNRKRAFGRVFYVEGRSLVFYAYDLGKAHTEKKITFHVWGAHSNDAETTISLGVLHDEDPNEQRWALTYDDPKVLAKINSVFVTIEPGNRDVVSPTGKKVLYAFLGERANHP